MVDFARFSHYFRCGGRISTLLKRGFPSGSVLLFGALTCAAQADDMPWAVTSPDADGISIQATAFAPSSPAGETGFTRIEAWETGIDKPLEFSLRDMWPPFWEGRAVSSADIDRDGDLDVAIASTEAGIYLFENDGTGQFTRTDTDFGDLAKMPMFNAVLADIDNDGWPDLFLTSYRHGNYVLRNVDGKFGTEPPLPVANRENAVLTMTMAISDPDRDGDLDIALGNWTAGWYRRIPGEESRNRIIWNENGELTGETFTDLPGIPGETLSVLFSDMNDDGLTDLLIGNDFDVPDYFYLGDGKGGFKAITYDDEIIPHTTTTTMAIKVGDLTGDGQNEIYLAQIAGRSRQASKILKMQDQQKYCDGIKRDADRALCEKNMEIKRWYRSGNQFDPDYAEKCTELTGRYQAECKAMLIKDLAIQKDDETICGLIPANQPVPRSFCDLHFKETRRPTPDEIDASLQQILHQNVMLEWNGTAYEDTAEERGLDIGGWSWDTKFEDFDNDGDQDVFIANGTWVPNENSPSNLYFENDGTGHFTEASGPSGLEDYLMTAGATSFDFDNDGDQDLLTHTVNGPLQLFRNNAQQQAVGFTLRDFVGNRDGIGAKITVTDENGRTRSREIQLGGGFMSFDAPRAYFGLGDATEVTEARIRWIDGAETVISGPLLPGSLYTIERR
ncbi:FG-GAP repeat [Thalassovita gelatinovora]|uniref:FG-GAP repeat n=2 Tax=Thalassovita gelatinovora TaxID=53501 RepID=A0A0N7LUG8_THAGE|nr:FG-GAP repeat [Thalassovita gelatinovora]SEQ67270.1 Repeat domain-containing protein [Thalassovita gelatinovora]